MSVIIVGGGPIGLLTSISLSHQGIPHTLFERYAGTSIHPKAVGLHPRTMEVLRSLGLEDAVAAASAPPHSHSKTAWYTDLGLARREIVTRTAWGGGDLHAPEYEAYSPSRYTVLPQIRLEPILLRRARELNPGGIVHCAEVVDVREDEQADRVFVSVRRGGTDGLVEEHSASYVIAADAGRTVGRRLGIAMRGEEGILDMVSAHLRAPHLRQWHPDPDVLILWFIDPARGGSINTGLLYHLGPYNQGSDGEEWMFACARRASDSKFSEEEMLARLRETLKIPAAELDGKVELLSLSHWLVNAVVADSFRSACGRVFLVGDAAHRIPPWGALGLNTGVQDVHNLVWKLALSLRHEKSGGGALNDLLDTYEAERRPIALRVAETSLANLRNHALAMDRALGIDPAKSAAENTASFNAYFDESHPLHAQMRDAVARAQAVLDVEFHAPGAEIGWFYPSVDVKGEGAATRHDGQINEDGEFELCVYYPSTIPGHHLPHFWVDRGGMRKSSRDLLRRDQCVLFARSEWLKGAGDVDVHVEVVDGVHWIEGAVLVRPDGIVAWRAGLSGEHSKNPSRTNWNPG
ncbi:FAD binding domain-containing protein [Aspergillus lucknowensis]|uniref:FAD binding domain-containing protein n=1 Tax=Aspergillus lucknowensis TaxID=176173 RepID=A0ABR4M357_9EURO